MPEKISSIAYQEAAKSQETEKEPTELKIVSWNTEGPVNSFENVMEAIEKFIDDGADVICLQESGTEERDGSSHIQRIQEMVRGTPWEMRFTGAAFHPDEGGPHEGWRHEALGLTMLINTERVQIHTVENLNLPSTEKLSRTEKYAAKIAIRGYRKRLGKGPHYRFDEHIEYRHAQVATLLVGEKTYKLVNMHLDWMGGKKHKATQLEYLSRELGIKGQPDGIVAIGDLNIPGQPDAEEAAKSISYTSDVGDPINEFRTVRPEEHTLRKGGYKMTPDFALVNEKVNVEEVDTYPEYFGSDHRPITVTVNLAENMD